MDKKLCIVVGIDSINNNKLYRVLLATISPKSINNQYNWKFECKMVPENNIRSILINNSMHWLNIELGQKGEIRGSSGDLKRLEPINGLRPFIIISQIVNSEDNIIGYKVANYNGDVKNIAIKEMIAFGNRAIKAGAIPVQNAIFVPSGKSDDKKAHFKSYPNKQFIKEVIITNKNKYSDKRRLNSSKNEKTLNRLDEIYTKEQIRELMIGKHNNVDIKIYANPNLSAEQMRVLRGGLEKKLNVKPFAFSDYSADSMRYYITDLQQGIDIRKYLSPKYNIYQLAQLSITAYEGLDVSQLQDPNLSWKQMEEIRIRLENNVFSFEDVKNSNIFK